MIAAVFFDLDGTLIDTEKYYRIFWPKAFAKLGVDLPDEQALMLRSLGKPFVFDFFQENFRDVDYYEIRRIRKSMMEPYLEKVGIDLKPGAVEILNWLKEKGIPTAVATATDQERANRYLDKLGLLPYFERVISAWSVERGKPAPDVYLYACEQLGERPEDCMAVEDSPNGVLSASGAGCKTVMVPDLTWPDPELRKKLFGVAENLEEIKRFF